MKLFGTDGIRGKANHPPITGEIAFEVGRAAAYVLKKKKHGREIILIGKDTRLSGYMIESALTSGICSMGVDVELVGPLPTPGIAFVTRGLRADAGVRAEEYAEDATSGGDSEKVLDVEHQPETGYPAQLCIRLNGRHHRR